VSPEGDSFSGYARPNGLRYRLKAPFRAPSLGRFNIFYATQGLRCHDLRYVLLSRFEGFDAVETYFSTYILTREGGDFLCRLQTTVPAAIFYGLRVGLPQNMPRDHHPLYFAGSLSYCHKSCIPIHPLNRIFPAVSISSQNLNGISANPFCHFCGE